MWAPLIQAHKATYHFCMRYIVPLPRLEFEAFASSLEGLRFLKSPLVPTEKILGKIGLSPTPVDSFLKTRNNTDVFGCTSGPCEFYVMLQDGMLT